MSHIAQFNLADLFEIVARTIPERIAIETDDATLTYEELDRRSNQLAAGLQSRGVERGHTVGLYLMNGLEYLEAFIGICKLGAIPFNVNYRYGSEELFYVFENAQAKAVLFNAEFEALARELDERLSCLAVLVSVGGNAPKNGNVITYGDLLENDGTFEFERSADDILLQYTGGTTGMPKGVMWPHEAFLFACLGGGGHFHPAGEIETPDDIAERALNGYQLKIFPIAPLMHGAAIWTAWSALLGGLTIVLDPMRKFDPVAIWDRVEKHGVQIVQIVGDAMARPLRDALRDNPDRWSLDHVLNFGSGGAVFSQHLKDDIKSFLPNAGITDGMGTSEGGISGMAEPSEDGMLRLPAGPDQQIIINGRIGGIGEVGLLGKSGHTPVGYYRDHEKTAEVFHRIGDKLWTLSGDQGRLDEDGMITLFGRGSTCINSGGEKVFPEEVESELRAHPSIHDAVVVGRPHERWGEEVVAIISLATGSTALSIDDVRTFLTKRLADYKRPRDLITVEEVRRSPAGKQDFRWAKSLILERASS